MYLALEMAWRRGPCLDVIYIYIYIYTCFDIWPRRELLGKKVVLYVGSLWCSRNGKAAIGYCMKCRGSWRSSGKW